MPNIIQELLASSPQTNVRASVSPIYVPSQEQQDWKARHSGIQGVARDILGGLGDFLLTRLHMKPMYAESKRNHELNYAAQGLDSPDQNTVNEALNRIQNVDFGTGMKLRDTLADNQRQALQQQSIDEARKERLANARDAVRNQYLGKAASYMNNIFNLPADKRAEKYAEGRLLYSNSNIMKSDPELQKMFNDFYPDKYDEDMLASSVGQYVPVSTQRAQKITVDKNADTSEYRNKSLGEKTRHDKVQEGIAAENAASRRISATRPRAGGSVKNIQTYVGEDGYKYTKRSDGTTVKSDIKVRDNTPVSIPNGTRRVINGKIYEWRDGSAVEIH